jgi:hypothetical protein
LKASEKIQLGVLFELYAEVIELLIGALPARKFRASVRS